MARNGFGIGERSGMTLQWRAKFRTAAMVMFALVAPVAAAAVFLGGAANAASLMSSGVDALEAYSVDKGFEEGAPSGDMWNLGTEAMSGSWPVIPTYTGGDAPGMVVPNRASEMVEVWNAKMTVGKTTDDTSFTYDGTDYNVEGIFHQQAGQGFRQVVLRPDKGMPEEMGFQAGDDRFPISGSRVPGDEKNFHAWPVNTSPGWAENQNIAVSLMAPSEPEPPRGPICG